MTLIFLCFLFPPLSYGQVINSMSPNKAGMYYYAVDSLISIVKVDNQIDRVFLRGIDHIVGDFPDTIQQIKIMKSTGKRNFNSKRLTDRDLLIKIGSANIVRDEVSIQLAVFCRKKNRLGPLEGGVYLFYFYYLPDSRTYELRRLKSGY